MPVEERYTASLIRSLAFLRKELVTVWRQPRLMATLVLGPFLILLLFGLGYRETPEPFRTLIVADEEDVPLGSDVTDLGESFGAGIEIVGQTDDADAARRRLANREVDLVVIAPSGAVQTLSGGEHPTFAVLHSEIDPVLTSSVHLLARLGVDEFNRRVLIGVVEEAQRESEGAEEVLAELDDAGTESEVLARAREANPEILVSPFAVETSPLVEPPSSQAVFYAPGVLILLVQHLALTFAALSLVRERELGITEIYRTSPLTVRETLTGKYLSFLVLGLLLAAALTATMLLLGVEIQGPVWSFTVVVALVILASLGLGFALSGLARSDSQAVQYSMVVLLVSIFFTGFVLPLDQLTAPVRYVSYLVPGTYGIAGLQDVVFRGQMAEPAMVGGLVLYAVVMAMLAGLALRRDVEPARSRALS
jgi:ABC-2 type transport system permease protein